MSSPGGNGSDADAAAGCLDNEGMTTTSPGAATVLPGAEISSQLDNLTCDEAGNASVDASWVMLPPTPRVANGVSPHAQVPTVANPTNPTSPAAPPPPPAFTAGHTTGQGVAPNASPPPAPGRSPAPPPLSLSVADASAVPVAGWDGQSSAVASRRHDDDDDDGARAIVGDFARVWSTATRTPPTPGGGADCPTRPSPLPQDFATSHEETARELVAILSRVTDTNRADVWRMCCAAREAAPSSLSEHGATAAAAASDNLLASITPLAFEALLAQANKPEEELTPAIATSVMEIDRDVCRTMGDEIRDDSERQALRNVLVAWSVRNPMAGYAQGLNAIAAMLLGPALTRLPPVTTVVRDEAGEVVRVAGGADLWAFQILCHMLEHGGAAEYYDHFLTGLHVDLAVVRCRGGRAGIRTVCWLACASRVLWWRVQVNDLLASALPDMNRAIAATGMDNAWFLTNFILSAFVNSTPMHHCRCGACGFCRLCAW